MASMQNDSPILVVDDSIAIRQTVRNTLVGMGYSNIHVAANGTEALQKSRVNTYKIVFLDWSMPEMNGLEFLKIYRNELKQTDSAVVMLTAKNGKEDILEAIESGATAYITKPVSLETIKKKMKQATEWLAARGEKTAEAAP